MLATGQAKQVSQLFKVLGDPFRVQLLLALEKQEACVCHLECLLRKRQAYISQHLMNLRKAGVLKARREGRFVYYSVNNQELFTLIRKTAESMGLKSKRVLSASKATLAGCDCPQCGNSI